MSYAAEETSNSEMQRGSVAFFIVLSASVFLVGFVEFMVSPLLGAISKAFDESLASTSWLISSYAASYAIAAPFVGRWTDRKDKYRVLQWAIALLAVDGFSVMLAPNLASVVLLRVIGGLGSAALIPTALALISDTVPPLKQARLMGWVMLGMTVGIVMGPAVGGVLTDLWGWRAGFGIVGVAALIIVLVSFANSPGQTSAPERGSPASTWYRQWNVICPLLGKGAFNGSGVAAFLLFSQVLPKRYNLNVAKIGLMSLFFGVGVGLGNVSVGWIRGRAGWEESGLVLVAFSLVAAIGSLVLFTGPLPVAVALLGCIGGCLGFGAPLATVVLTRRCAEAKGSVLAVGETLNNIFIFVLVPLGSLAIQDSWLGGAGAVLVPAVGLGTMLFIHSRQLGNNKRIASK